MFSEMEKDDWKAPAYALIRVPERDVSFLLEISDSRSLILLARCGGSR
jgi:hypothetical protein